MNEKYKNKYLKYKNRYFNLINKHKQTGGSTETIFYIGSISLIGLLLWLIFQKPGNGSVFSSSISSQNNQNTSYINRTHDSNEYKKLLFKNFDNNLTEEQKFQIQKDEINNYPSIDESERTYASTKSDELRRPYASTKSDELRRPYVTSESINCLEQYENITEEILNDILDEHNTITSMLPITIDTLINLEEDSSDLLINDIVIYINRDIPESILCKIVNIDDNNFIIDSIILYDGQYKKFQVERNTLYKIDKSILDIILESKFWLHDDIIEVFTHNIIQDVDVLEYLNTNYPIIEVNDFVLINNEFIGKVEEINTDEYDNTFISKFKCIDFMNTQENPQETFIRNNLYKIYLDEQTLNILMEIYGIDTVIEVIKSESENRNQENIEEYLYNNNVPIYNEWLKKQFPLDNIFDNLANHIYNIIDKYSRNENSDVISSLNNWQEKEDIDEETYIKLVNFYNEHKYLFDEPSNAGLFPPTDTLKEDTLKEDTLTRDLAFSKIIKRKNALGKLNSILDNTPSQIKHTFEEIKNRFKKMRYDFRKDKMNAYILNIDNYTDIPTLENEIKATQIEYENNIISYIEFKLRMGVLEQMIKILKEKNFYIDKNPLIENDEDPNDEDPNEEDKVLFRDTIKKYLNDANDEFSTTLIEQLNSSKRDPSKYLDKFSFEKVKKEVEKHYINPLLDKEAVNVDEDDDKINERLESITQNYLNNARKYLNDANDQTLTTLIKQLNSSDILGDNITSLRSFEKFASSISKEISESLEKVQNDTKLTTGPRTQEDIISTSSSLDKNAIFDESLEEVQNEAFQRSIAIEQKLTTLNELFSGIPEEFENIKNELFNPDNTNNENVEERLLTLKNTLKTDLKSSIVYIKDLKTLTDKSSDLKNSLDRIHENVGTLVSEIIRSNTNKEEINKEVILEVAEMTNEKGGTKRINVKPQLTTLSKSLKKTDSGKLLNSRLFKTGKFSETKKSEKTEEAEEAEEAEETEETEEAEEVEEVEGDKELKTEELEDKEMSNILSQEKSNEAWQTFPDPDDNEEVEKAEEALRAIEQHGQKDEQAQEQWGRQREESDTEEQKFRQALKIGRDLYITYKNFNLDIRKKMEFIIRENYDHFIYIILWLDNVFQTRKIDEIIEKSGIELEIDNIKLEIDNIKLEIDNLIENFIEGSIIMEKEVSKSEEFPLPLYYDKKIDYFKNYMLYIKSNFGEIPFYQDREERKITKNDIKDICKNYKKHKDSQYIPLVRLKLSDDLLSFNNFIKIKNKYYNVKNNKNIKYIHNLMLKQIKKTILYYLEELRLVEVEESEQLANDLEYKRVMAQMAQAEREGLYIPPENCVELIEDQPKTGTLDKLLNELDDKLDDKPPPSKVSKKRVPKMVRNFEKQYPPKFISP